MPAKLPLTVVTKLDVLDLADEINSLQDKLRASNVREKVKGAISHDEIQLSQEAQELFDENGWKLSIKSVENAAKVLNDIKNNEPILKFVFASKPDNDFVNKLLNWCRKEISENCLIHIKEDDSIGGGFLLSTPAKTIDMSFSKVFARYKDKLQELVVNASQ